MDCLLAYCQILWTDIWVRLLFGEVCFQKSFCARRGYLLFFCASVWPTIHICIKYPSAWNMKIFEKKKKKFKFPLKLSRLLSSLQGSCWVAIRAKKWNKRVLFCRTNFEECNLMLDRVTVSHLFHFIQCSSC